MDRLCSSHQIRGGRTPADTRFGRPRQSGFPRTGSPGRTRRGRDGQHFIAASPRSGAADGGAPGRAVGAGVLRPAERRAPGQPRHPCPGAGRAAGDLHRPLPARRLGSPDQQLGAVLRARLPGAARRDGPLVAVVIDLHRGLRTHRLAADSGQHDHRRRERPDLRLARVPAGPRAVVSPSRSGGARRGRAAGLRRADLGRVPGSAGVSWQAHLGGAVGGVFAAWLLHRRAASRRPVAPSYS